MPQTGRVAHRAERWGLALDFLLSPNKWNADRARFLADGGGCEMQRLGELLCDECAAKEL